MEAVIFDSRGFSLHDGPGIRTTVFFKGCPLQCAWCHNPEGLDPCPQLMVRETRCRHCGLCRRGCAHADCQKWGRCLHVCPDNLVAVCGETVSAPVLAARLLRDRAIWEESGGGVTFSGGEPLLQASFLQELIPLLDGVHTAIETSGFADAAVFDAVTAAVDFVMMDLKLADSAAHRHFTGVDNGEILRNAARLRESGRPHLFRVPLIPGITDIHGNLRALAEIAGDSEVELLPYNALAGTKYASVGRVYGIAPDAEASVSLDEAASMFTRARG